MNVPLGVSCLCVYGVFTFLWVYVVEHVSIHSCYFWVGNCISQQKWNQCRGLFLPVHVQINLSEKIKSNFLASHAAFCWILSRLLYHFLINFSNEGKCTRKSFLVLRKIRLKYWIWKQTALLYCSAWAGRRKQHKCKWQHISLWMWIPYDHWAWCVLCCCWQYRPDSTSGSRAIVFVSPTGICSPHH